MSKFKVGDNVKCITRCLTDTAYGNVYTVLDVSDLRGDLYFVYTDDVGDRVERLQSRFELVEHNPVLTPEEVFEHFRKGTKLQWLCKSTDNWVDHSGTLNHLKVNELLDYAWRIKPEPEVIELNGKKYREIVE